MEVVIKNTEVPVMKHIKQVLWGVILVTVGAILGSNALGLTNIDIFFDGWWTLFMIIPCATGLLSGKDRTGNLIGLGIGIALLLGCRDIVDFDILWNLLLPVIIVIIGVKLIYGSFSHRQHQEPTQHISANHSSGPAVFSGETVTIAGEEFRGTTLTAVFGGVECDLRNAIIHEDCAITASAIFGGIDIFVPAGINVKVNSNSIFGGVSNKTAVHQNAPTLYISGTCMFGGVEIK